MPSFCSPFDEALGAGGPASVFLVDREGALRFAPEWTRDCWERAPGPHAHGWTWVLLRDRASAFVVLALVTSPTLLPAHPRLDVRAFPTYEAARRDLEALGNPPLAREPW